MHTGDVLWMGRKQRGAIHMPTAHCCSLYLSDTTGQGVPWEEGLSVWLRKFLQWTDIMTADDWVPAGAAAVAPGVTRPMAAR